MSAPSPRPETLLRALLAPCVAFALIVYFVYGIAMIAFPSQIDYGEGVAFQLTQTLSDGQPLYRDPATYPWLVDPYAPLYTALCAALRPLCGLTLAAGRLLSWGAALLTLICVAFAAAGRGADRRQAMTAALCASAFFICSPLTVNWAALYRVDFVGLCFETAGLLLVDNALRRDRGGLIWCAAPLFVAAFFTKQTFVLGLAAATIALIAWRPRVGAAFAVGTGAAMGAVFMGLDRGGHLFASLFSNNVMPWSWERAWPWVSQYALLSMLPLAAVALSLTRREQGLALWWTWLLLTSLTLVGVGRVGAYYNHFLPFHTALSIAAGIAVSRLMEADSEGFGRAWLVGALTLLQVVGCGIFGALKPTLPSLATLATNVVASAPGLPARIAREHERVHADIATLNRYPGDVVAENMALAVLAGRPSAMCDPSTLFGMAEAGRWDEAAFIDAVRRHRFGVVVLQRLTDNPRFSPAALEVISREYVEVGTVGGDHLLVPRQMKTSP